MAFESKALSSISPFSRILHRTLTRLTPQIGHAAIVAAIAQAAADDDAVEHAGGAHPAYLNFYSPPPSLEPSDHSSLIS